MRKAVFLWLAYVALAFSLMRISTASYCDTLRKCSADTTSQFATVEDAKLLYSLVGNLLDRGLLQPSAILDALVPLAHSVRIEAALSLRCEDRPNVLATVPIVQRSLIRASRSSDAVALHSEDYDSRFVESVKERPQPSVARQRRYAMAPSMCVSSFMSSAIGSSTLSAVSSDCLYLVDLNASLKGTAFSNVSCLSDCCFCPEVQCNSDGRIISLSVQPAAGSLLPTVWQLQSLETLRIIGAEYGALSDIELLEHVVEFGPLRTAVGGNFPFPAEFPRNISSLILYGSFSGQLPSSLPHVMKSFHAVGSFSGVMHASLLSMVGHSLQVVGSFSTSIPAVRLQNSLQYLSIEGCIGSSLTVLEPFPPGLLLLDAYGNHLGGQIPQSVGSLFQLQTLYISLNQLSGPIPASLGNLSKLKTLALYINELSGNIPSSLGNMSQLQYMSLHSNELSGPIPQSLGSLYHLQNLDLHSNQLTGPIPDSLSNLSQLQFLLLQSNHLAGPIPESLGKLSHLLKLSVHSNHLSGVIPVSLQDLVMLQYLGLHDNELSGPLPDWLGQLTQLQFLGLHSNALTGSIPASLGRLSHLQTLSLYFNQLSGSIPGSLGNVSELQYLSLHSNQLTGPIPASLGNLRNLQNLVLHSNQLTGPIPASLGKLSQLQFLFADSNYLQGQIPQSIGNLSKLQTLALSANRLSGSIPESLGSLSQLRAVRLQSNQLTGFIPKSLGRLTQLRYLHMEQNFLEGRIPQSLCQLSLLQGLYLSSNQLTLFPNCSFPQLSVLTLAVNQLSSFPFHLIAGFKSLVSLDVANNTISGPFPVSIFMGGLPLRTLSLANNNFSGPIPFYPCGYDDPETGIYYKFFSASALSVVDLSGNIILGAPGVTDFARGSCYDCTFQYYSLAVLRIANARIQPVSPAFRTATCSVSDGPFTDIFGLLTGLVSLDISSNNISVKLDPIFTSLPLLSFLDMRENGRASNSTSLSPNNRDIFSFDPLSAVAVDQRLICYSAQVSSIRLAVAADPSFFDYRNCVCRAGYYGKPPACEPCTGDLKNAKCSFLTDSVSTTLVTYNAWNLSGNILANEGYFASPSVSYDDMYFNRSYPRAIELCEGAGTDLTPCKPSVAGPCVDGYEGRLCTNCADGYFHTGDLCNLCPTGAGLVFFSLGFVLATMGLVGWSFFVSTSSSGFAKILILFVQCLFYVRPAMPSSLSAITQGSSSMAMLSLDGPKCMFSSWSYDHMYVTAIAGAFLVPLFSFVIFAVGVLVMWVCDRYTPAAAKQWLDRCRRSALFLAVFLYMPAVNAILPPLACTKDAGDGFEYLVAVPYMRCSSTLRAWSIALLVLYVLGFPATCAILVYQSRVLSHDESTLSRRRYLYGLLFGSFRPSCSTWEIVITIRRLVLIIAFATVPRLSALQTVVAEIALGGSLVVHCVVGPYRTRSENAFEGICLTVLLLNYASGLKAQVVGVQDVDIGGVVIFMFNVAAIAAGAVLLLSTTGPKIIHRLGYLFRNRSATRRNELPDVVMLQRPLLEDDRDGL